MVARIRMVVGSKGGKNRLVRMWVQRELERRGWAERLFEEGLKSRAIRMKF